jgi:hypothetical protein
LSTLTQLWGPPTTPSASDRWHKMYMVCSQQSSGEFFWSLCSLVF